MVSSNCIQERQAANLRFQSILLSKRATPACGGGGEHPHRLATQSDPFAQKVARVMWSASASHSMIASQKKPAPAKAIVSPLCSRNSMKIAAAISALVSAIV